MDNLRKFKKEPQISGIATDFDGTISAIASTPGKAFIDPVARKLLEQLSTQYKIVSVISGRRVKQLDKLVNLPGLFYIGNHGAEYLFDSQYWVVPEAQKIAPILDTIDKDLQQLKEKNIILDNKKYSLSIHYRQHQNPVQAEQTLARLLEKYIKPGLKIRKGRMVFDLSATDIDKGFATKYLVERFNLKNFLYIGDDQTDLDAFSALDKLSYNSISSIKVAFASPESPPELPKLANLTVSSLQEVNSLFKQLL